MRPAAFRAQPVLSATAFLALTLAAALQAQSPASTRPTRHPQSKPSAQDTPAATLPVTRVALYKNGVGFFEHSGRVTGDAAVSIGFTTAQLNDVLQSLTAVDLNGGRIAGAGYNSTTPLEQQLKNLPLALSEDTTALNFYTALRGARVEVHSPAGSITGRLLAVEERQLAPVRADSDTDTPAPTRQFLTVVADDGTVRSPELTPSTTVRLLDSAVHSDVTRYLQLVAANRSQGLRHLTLEDRGAGTRELRVSYLSEVPVWKSTYRLLFTDSGASTSSTATLQGWSVVDNTTGEDWINVQLALIAGSPQSFIQPLSEPIYSRRPQVAIAQEAQLTPQTFESSNESGTSVAPGLHGTVKDPAGAVLPNASVTATNTVTNARSNAATDSEGRFSLSLPDGVYRVQITAPGFNSLVRDNVTISGVTTALNAILQLGAVNDSVEVTAVDDLRPRVKVRGGVSHGVLGGIPAASPRAMVGLAALPPPPTYEAAASASLLTNTSSTSFDDFFQYQIADPITIRKNESALVPILQAKIPAERVTLVSSPDGRSLSQPLRALWITNSTGLTLDRGSFTLVENGAFGGEGLLDPIHPNEKRLLSYAADQAVHVSTDQARPQTSRVTRISISKGVLQIGRSEQRDTTYVIHNAAPEARTVVLEHPIQRGFTLSPDTKPAETTDRVYRFRVTVAPGATERLHVPATSQGTNFYQLLSSDESQLAFFVTESGNNPQLQAALAPILDARRRVADAQNAVNETTSRLDALREDEQRQRANITALASADKSSRDRFVRDLNKTEDSIAAAQSELATRSTALAAANQDLANRVEALQLNVDVAP